jgi:4-hydroxybenzoate polyprenyltransferase
LWSSLNGLFYTINAETLPRLDIIFYWVGGFALFAFLTTFIREIIKDIEDFEGDNAYGRNTVPVVTGILTARIISISLILITVGLLYTVWHFFLNDKITLIYISCAIVLPLLYVIYQLIISANRKRLHIASRLIKVVMIAGLLYSVVAKVILDQNLV